MAETTASKLVSDEFWEVVQPLLPPELSRPKGGRPRRANRAVLAGIVYVLKTGIPWNMLPQEIGCGSGVTCWRRLRDWQRSGVWQRLLQVLQDKLGRGGCIDWSRASLDSASVPAKRGVRRPALTQYIGVDLAPSITCSSTGGASLWPPPPPRPTSMTPSYWKRWLTRSDPQRVLVADHANGRISYMRTKPMTTRAAERPYVVAA